MNVINCLIVMIHISLGLNKVIEDDKVKHL